MKSISYVLAIIFVFFALTGCGARPNNYLSREGVTENWQRRIVTNPQIWKEGADKWFLTAEPNDLEKRDKAFPADYAMSTMSVAVPSFTTIRIDGGFQTQIYGTTGHNKVDLFGPNAGVSSVNVDVLDNTVLIHARPDADPAVTKVIVRIGVQNLEHLVQLGCGPIDVIQITSPRLAVETTHSASGDIYLSGHVNLQSVSQAGSSTINIFGVDSRQLRIDTCGCAGGVNLFGNVGVRQIRHNGTNDINIIGANSPSLSIFARGAGKVGIKGFVRLNKVEARDYTQVYVSQSASRLLYADAYDYARIGISGSAGNLYTNTFHHARFWGKSLCAKNAFAVSQNYSHINITACNKAYAKAYDSSSIYFFGPDYLLNSFERDQGRVLATGERNFCNQCSEFRDYDYTDSHAQRACFVGAG